MDGFGPALFGLFLVSFTVSKPVSLYHQLILSSSESSESNESTSSEEVTIPRTTLQPMELNTMIPDSLEDDLLQPNHTERPDLVYTTSESVFTEQIVVEVEMNVNASLSPLQPAVHVTLPPEGQRVVFPDFTTPELRCYTVPATSPPPKPARGDDI